MYLLTGMTSPSTRQIESFWTKVQRAADTECWPYLGYRTAKGYGLHGRTTAHRFVYIVTFGPVPKGYTIDHLCRCRHCVNPAHLQAVPHRANVARGTARAAAGAKLTHCPDCGRPIEYLNVPKRWGCRACFLPTQRRKAMERYRRRKGRM